MSTVALQKSESPKALSKQPPQKQVLLHDGVRPHSFSGFPIQTKLTIGSPNDKYEREADAMANRIMRMPMNLGYSGTQGGASIPSIQTKCAACAHEEERIRRKPYKSTVPNIQTKCAACENEKHIQRKPLMLKSEGGVPQATPALGSQLNTTKGSGSPLSSGTNQFMSHAFGTDFSHVRVHTDSRAQQMNQGLNARAFTHGSDIYFNQGEYNPGSSRGKRLLGHELTHVVQQSRGAQKIQRTTATRIRPNVVEVQDNDETYRVVRTYQLRTGAGTQTSVTPNVDANNVSLTLRICRNRTLVTGTLGGNLTGAARQIAGQILQAITSGSPADIETILRDTDLTPFLQVVLAQSGQFRLTARGEVTVGTEGVSAGGGSLNLGVGPVDISVRAQGSEDGGVTISGGVTITPGRTNPNVRCTRIRAIPSFSCQKHFPASEQPITLNVPFRETATRFLYFNFENDSINQSLSDPMLDSIRTLLGEGYRVTRITGHTSPEGPMNQRRPRGFMGNTELANRRATAALAQIQSMCSSLNMRNPLQCAENVTRDVQPIGMGELHTLLDSRGHEVEGRRLGRHAYQQFRTSESESPHRTEQLLRSLEQMTESQRTEEVYSRLRRATIYFEKSGVRPITINSTVPAGFSPVDCPRNIIDAARPRFQRINL